MVLAESVSMAMLVVLETLGPDERAVFVLREVFAFDYDEIASAVGKSVATVRQIAHRARAHVQSRRKRFEPVDPQRSEQITAQFLAAAASGDVDALLEMLAPDVTWTADGGGKVTASRRPIVGAKKVAGAIVGIMRIGQRIPNVRIELATCNSAPAVLVYRGESIDLMITVEVADGKIVNFYAIRNPEKLAGIDVRREISR